MWVRVACQSSVGAVGAAAALAAAAASLAACNKLSSTRNTLHAYHSSCQNMATWQQFFVLADKLLFCTGARTWRS